MSRTLGMKEGILVCCGLIALGMVLQQTAGPVRWGAMTWPVNGIVLAVLVLGIVLMSVLRGKVRLFRWMATLQAGIPAIVACAMLTVLMGVTRQAPSGHVPVDSIGITAMLSFWPFVLTYLWLMVLVGMVCLTRLRPKWRNIPFLLNHLGIFIALVAGTLGNADMQRLRMMVQEGQTGRYAYDASYMAHELPFVIELHDFSIQESPKLSYMSDVTVRTKSGVTKHDTIRVNKPLSIRGWKVYQYGYDEARGAESNISIFELVRDPWLPYVYIGIFMMLAGAVTGLIGKKVKD